MQIIHQNRLKEILNRVSNQLKNIDLVFVSSCYSETLGELFLEYGVKNVIYIQGKTPISDRAAIKFSEYFYSELIKSSTVKDAFNKSIRIVQSDKEKDYFQITKCCCTHWHKEKCYFMGNKDYNHNRYHIKCDCEYDESNIHEENCQLILLIKKDKVEDLFYFEKNINNTIKICCSCCKPSNDNIKEKMLPHEESFKFILKQNNQHDNTIIFQSKKPGKLYKNKNCYIMNDKDKFKNFSIVGRRLQIKEIYDIIDGPNINNIHFIIIHGLFEAGKQNFSELVCIYLFERKAINGFTKIEIKELEELSNKIKELTQNGKNSDGNYIVIIKINNEIENNIDLINEILNEKSILYPNFYYIILLSTSLDKIDYLIQSHSNKYHIIYLANLNLKSSFSLLCELCKSYGYEFNIIKFKDKQIKELLELIGYSRKKVNELAELIGKNYNYEKLKEIIQSKDFNDNDNDNTQNELRKSMEKDISKIYFYLSAMIYGLPSSMLKLFEPDYKKIIKKEDELNLINKE